MSPIIKELPNGMFSATCPACQKTFEKPNKRSVISSVSIHFGKRHKEQQLIRPKMEPTPLPSVPTIPAWTSSQLKFCPCCGVYLEPVAETLAKVSTLQGLQ